MKINVKFDFHLIAKNLVAEKLNKLDIDYCFNPNGEITILQKLSKAQTTVLFEELNSSGINIMDNPQLILVQQIKEIIVEIVRLDNFDERLKVSSYIDERLPFSYSYLSKVFSEYTYMSIEKFLILKKIDYVKELLAEGNMSLTEIAYKLNYSSVSHLSKQFKKTTGFSPSYFLNLKTQLKSGDHNSKENQ